MQYSRAFKSFSDSIQKRKMEEEEEDGGKTGVGVDREAVQIGRVRISKVRKRKRSEESRDEQ
ncbi:hypothetical protein E2C01_088528 [Portunus trituberculatus]|uniref:Uncharacterized protein n=1 Tax=Portunus trituberculatus TaxID=210409 RepID=A0A5B7JB06_PORTR|nr:hypothetical protein [Portunus trituberculatus]